MDAPLTDAYQSDDDELCGGFLQAQNAAVLQRLYDPKLTQSRFTGKALLAPDATRLRPKEAMQFWTAKKTEPKEVTAPEVTGDKTAALQEDTATLLVGHQASSSS